MIKPIQNIGSHRLYLERMTEKLPQIAKQANFANRPGLRRT
jgi:hypothetical protein